MKRVVFLLAVIALAGCATSTPRPEPIATSVMVPETEAPVIGTEPDTPAATEVAAVSTLPPAFEGECVVTPADGEGPFYLAGAPIRDAFSSLVTSGMAGDRLNLSGVVYLEGCQTVLAGAVVEIWQVDAQGNYDLSGYTLRGGVRTDSNGAYAIETILPPSYGGRPQHIHYKVIADGRPAFTSQIYFTGDTRAAGFPTSMLINPVPADGGGFAAIFNIVLAGQ